jgi:acetyl/propionyl-CoA carboxylase alpha subunit
VTAGSEVTLHYDSMLAKLITHGATRADAIAAMRRALGELVVVGVATNAAFHLALLDDADFQTGQIDIQFLERRPDLLESRLDEATSLRLAITAALLEDERRQSRQFVTGSPAELEPSAWQVAARRDAVQ